MHLFSPDSKFMRAMSRIGDLMLLNLLFLLCSVPVFTIGAAAAALYTVCFRFDTEREGSAVHDYFLAFRQNFRQGTLLWLIFLLCGAAVVFDIWIFWTLPGAARYLVVVFAILLLVLVLTAAVAFPLLSQFQSRNRDILKNALALGLGYLPRVLCVAALGLFPFVLLYSDFYLFLHTGFIWVALYFSSAAYLSARILKKVFAPYREEDDA